MQKTKFYSVIRTKYPLPDSDTGRKRIEGFEKLIDYGRANKIPAKYLAYILATAYHETAHTMQPVREAFWLSDTWRKNNLRYYPWYGRGYVQLTWEDNYKKAQQKLNLGTQLTDNPDLVMNPDIATPILFVGSIEGWFTGKKLSDYIKIEHTTDAVTRTEYRNSRRVINAMDKATEIATIGVDFYKALREASYDFEVVSLPVLTEPPVQPPVIETKPIEETKEQEIVIRANDLNSITLEQLYQAIKTLKGE